MSDELRRLVSQLLGDVCRARGLTLEQGATYYGIDREDLEDKVSAT